MASKIVSVSLCDRLIFKLGYALPNALQGLFKRSPFWVGFFHRLHPDPTGARLLKRWRGKYHARYFWVGPRTLLVVDPYGVRRVLEHSPAVYADPPAKRKGMAHFQPNAVTISRPPLWELRRRFNEKVLATGRLHPYAEHFLRAIREEVREIPTAALAWPAFERLFQRITLRIVFGDHARDNAGLVEAFDTLMFQANRLTWLRPNYPFAKLYQEIHKYLDKPAPHTLAFLCNQVGQSFKDAKGTDTRIDIASQIPHWLFAMKDTLAINTAYCLALLADHPAAGDRARAELADTPGNAGDVDAATFLGGCVQEAMRLWPTTPMLERECAVPDILGDDVLLPGTRVIIWNTCNHRNPEAYPDCDRFRPERWSEPGAEMWFNHLSSGPQGCAGKELALFIAKAVIAELQRGRRWHNRRPVVDAAGAAAGSINPFQVALDAVVI